jgi:hypothetical protein
MSSDARSSRFPVPQLKDLPPDVRKRILAVQEESGFVLNVSLKSSPFEPDDKAFSKAQEIVRKLKPFPFGIAL